MKRRDFLSATAAVSALTACSQSQAGSRFGSLRRQPQRPNIFYICVDDLGTQLGCYGNEEVVSPNFDRFAEDSLLFEQAHCQVAVCTASRTSILTGMRPEETGLWTLRHDWRAELPGVRSLPETLLANGYDTISVGKIWDPRSGDGNDAGWIEKVEEWGVDSNEQAFALLDQYAGGDRPIALFLGYRDPHCPWEPPAQSLAAYDDRLVSIDGPGRTFPSEYLEKCSGVNAQQMSDADALDVTTRYYAEVTEVDRLVGEFIDRLKVLGLYESSVIVLWSGDHGYHLGENDHWGKWTNYSQSTRVPLMIRAPSLTANGRRCPRVVECVDMYPTLCELAGIPAPEHLQGDSLVGLLSAPNRSWKPAGFSIWVGQSDEEDWASGRSVKTDRYNYIRFNSGRTVLFDVIADPKETTDVSGEHPDIIEDLEVVLAGGWTGVKAKWEQPPAG